MSCPQEKTGAPLSMNQGKPEVFPSRAKLFQQLTAPKIGLGVIEAWQYILVTSFYYSRNELADKNNHQEIDSFLIKSLC